MRKSDGVTPIKTTRAPSSSDSAEEILGTGTNLPFDHATCPLTEISTEDALLTGTYMLPIADALYARLAESTSTANAVLESGFTFQVTLT
jgi:predicted nucleic acid-binding protein